MRKTDRVTPDSKRLRDSVREAYSSAASRPQGFHPFPVGAELARSLGYPDTLLAAIPASSVEAFSGVSNVSLTAGLTSSGTVVDLGCGSGMDALIAAHRVGPRGRVIGLDFSPAMLHRADSASRQAGFQNSHFLQAAAERIPLASASADHALVDGIFNLNPFRAQIFLEIARILKPGGTIFAAELVLQAPLDSSARTGAANWFS